MAAVIDVQQLVLGAPCDAWPSMTELVSHRGAPVDGDTQLMSLIAALPSSVLKPSASSEDDADTSKNTGSRAGRAATVFLSRIGLSIFLLARWKWSGGVWCAQVRHPLSNGLVHFPVLECVPQSALPCRPLRGRPSVDGERIVFSSSATSMRIVLCPKSNHTVTATAAASSPPLRNASLVVPSPTLVEALCGAWERDGEPMEPWLLTLAEHIQRSLIAGNASSTRRGGDPISFFRRDERHYSSGILVHGPPGVGKSSQVERLLRHVATHACDSSAALISTRVVHVSMLFEQTNHMTDPATVLVQAVQPPPPVQQDDGNDGIPSPCGLHVVFLDGVEALGGGSVEPFVLVAIHALAQWLEQQQCSPRSSSRRLLIISAVTDVALVHPLLRTRSALQTVALEATPPSEALRRFVYAQHHREPCPHPDAAVAAWVEATAGWTMPRIKRHLVANKKITPMSSSPTARSVTNDGGGAVVDTRRIAQVQQLASPLQELVGVDRVVATIEQLLLRPLRHQRALERAGVQCPKGALIVGPSGSGKTALLSALFREMSMFGQTSATAAPGEDSVLQPPPRLHVVMVDALSLLQKEVGQSEKNIQLLLAEARASAPSVVFIDNLDAVAPPRGGEDAQETNITADRTLSTLLAELDGVREQKKPLLVVASAPTVASLDAAMTRPGRLDLHVSLALPSDESVADLIATRLGAEIQHACGASTADALASGLLIGIVRGAMQRAMRPLTYADAVSAARTVVLGLCSNFPDVATAIRSMAAGAEGDAVAAMRGAVGAFVEEALLQR